jgi:hypothetical protein
MGKLRMIAGRQTGGGGGDECFGAYVVFAAGRSSRIFSVRGANGTSQVDELPAATTIDMRRFESALDKEIGGAMRPSETAICDIVRRHLKTSEDLDVD